MNYSPTVSMNWQSTAEGETILQYLYNPQTSGRKFFGLLERPAVPPSVEEVSYKLFVVGNTGVGKTATIARLAGVKCSSTYYETPGIQKTNIYWPVKIWDKLIMFKLQFWDAGDNCRKKYTHIHQSSQSKADAIVFVFSFTDRASFLDLEPAMMTLSKTGEEPAILVIGTRHKSNTQLQVTTSDIKEFETKHQIPILRIENKWSSGRNEVRDVSSLLNVICEKLWLRDQDYLHKHGMTKEFSVSHEVWGIQGQKKHSIDLTPGRGLYDVTNLCTSGGRGQMTHLLKSHPDAARTMCNEERKQPQLWV